MARVKLIQNKGDIAPEHYPLFDELAALRGRISGPSTVMLHSPALARPWNEVSEFLHRLSCVQPRYAELAVSAAAREYDCAYVWAAHVPKARKAGVGEATFSAVAKGDGGALDGLPPEDIAVVSYVRQLLRANRVDSAVFDPLLAAHGARWMVELTAWIGRYSALSFILNTFEVFPAAGKEPLPEAPAAAPRKIARPPLAAPRVAFISSREDAGVDGQAVFDSVAEGRRSVRGPFALMMHSPLLCQRVFDVSNCLRFASLLTPRIRELVTIVTAREQDCPYVWASHASAARREGVPDSTIALIRENGAVAALAPAEADVVEFTRQVLRSHRVTQALFNRLRDAHGVQWLVELTALIGHYRVITALLNAFEVAPSAAAESLLD